MFLRQVSHTVWITAPQRAIALRGAAVRAFAAATARDGRPPIDLFGLDGTYATALASVPAYSSQGDVTL